MTIRMKGFILAVLQVAIVLSLGGKLLYDRAHCPRVWVKTGSVDPELPIRGRYLTLNLEVHAPTIDSTVLRSNRSFYNNSSVELAVQDGKLIANKTTKNTGMSIASWGRQPSQNDPTLHFLWPSVAFFLPEHAEVPRIIRGEELWAEVTIPKKGPPRPIQLALKNGSSWIPLTYR